MGCVVREGGFNSEVPAANPLGCVQGVGTRGCAGVAYQAFSATENCKYQPTMLVAYVGRYRCRACSRSWCDDISQAAPHAKLPLGPCGSLCADQADNMPINRMPLHLAVAWHTVNEAILPMGKNSCWRIDFPL